MSVWEQCAPYLSAAVDRSPGDWTLAQVEAEIRAGRAHLWPGDGCAVVTQPYRALNVWLAGGDLTGVCAMLESAEAFARALDCDEISVSDARPGWGRVLAPLGFRPQTMLVKELP